MQTMNYYCNPMNLEYKYQLFGEGTEAGGLCSIYREAADPSLVLFKGLYYLFPSMSAGFYTSRTLADWEFHSFLGKMPVNDYAPDIRVRGDYLYFCASGKDRDCSFFRTRDPLTEPFEEIRGSFSFWDPNLFVDDDGRIYLYWGSSNSEPLYGVELDGETMRPLGEKRGLIETHEELYGYERLGEDYVPPRSEEEIQAVIQEVLRQYSAKDYEPDEKMKKQFYRWFGNSPYLEGPWMTKYRGKYYLQYAVTGTEHNVYADGVYVGDSPLGPFVPARNNPYSYKPGGFITGAGHGSTVEDRKEGFWHISTMRISRQHTFERRLGLWRAAFDEEGELCCDQRYGDWPMRIDAKIWEKPQWMLLSFRKPVRVSSGEGAEAVTDENIRTWWQAACAGKEEWVEIDLERPMDVHAVQINFGDHWAVEPEQGMEFVSLLETRRCIDIRKKATRWLLEGSADGIRYDTLEDKSAADTDLSHDLIVWEEGRKMRFLRLRAMELPYGQNPCVSGIRVFGLDCGEKPEQIREFEAVWEGADQKKALDLQVSWEDNGAVGCNILWGYAPDRLYHSYMVYAKTSQKIGALVQGSEVYMRIDSFNESGITEGIVKKVREA